MPLSHRTAPHPPASGLSHAYLAHGPPGGKPWQQLQCVVCQGYFQETHGTLLHGKRVSSDMLVWAVGALAEGLGIRAVVLGFAVDPNTVLPRSGGG